MAESEKKKRDTVERDKTHSKRYISQTKEIQQGTKDKGPVI